MNPAMWTSDGYLLSATSAFKKDQVIKILQLSNFGLVKDETWALSLSSAIEMTPDLVC